MSHFLINILASVFLTKVWEKFLRTSFRYTSRRCHTSSFSSSYRIIGFILFIHLGYHPQLLGEAGWGEQTRPEAAARDSPMVIIRVQSRRSNYARDSSTDQQTVVRRDLLRVANVARDSSTGLIRFCSRCRAWNKNELLTNGNFKAICNLCSHR